MGEYVVPPWETVFMQLGRRLSEDPLHCSQVQTKRTSHQRSGFYSSMAQHRAGDMLTWSQILVHRDDLDLLEIQLKRMQALTTGSADADDCEMMLAQYIPNWLILVSRPFKFCLVAAFNFLFSFFSSHMCVFLLTRMASCHLQLAVQGFNRDVLN